MTEIPKFIKPSQLSELQDRFFLEAGIEEIAVVRNPSYVHPPLDYYPLAPRSKGNLASLVGVVKDMDGTTTTTETLCLHSLEHMTRRITDRMDPAAWAGLDRARDYPHIIGNSTTRHVEYLVRTYEKDIVPDALGKSFLRAALWTLAEGRDAGRRREVEESLRTLGFEGCKAEPLFESTLREGKWSDEKTGAALAGLWEKYRGRARLGQFHETVRAAIDVYYMRYHEILAALERGTARGVAHDVLGDASRRLIEPMPGVAVYLALLKGWLGEAVAKFGPNLFDHVKKHVEKKGQRQAEANLRLLPALGRYFERHPLKIGVVTSSIFYEANIVLGQVFEVLREQVADWPVSSEKRERIQEGFQSPHQFYDAFVTASDSSEIRLKPHRDLYSIALYRMGIAPEDFHRVVGFEDSESGTIAIRAAGIGLCVAVPFSDTAGHDLSAAAFCLHGGLPETILRYLHFLDPRSLTDSALRSSRVAL